jgi:hypothetical protein
LERQAVSRVDCLSNGLKLLIGERQICLCNRANSDWQASVQRLLKDPDLRVIAQPRVYESPWNCIPATICRESSPAVAHWEPNHGAAVFHLEAEKGDSGVVKSRAA